MSNDFICSIEQLTFRAIPSRAGKYPAKKYIQDLDQIAARDFRVAARVLATTLAIGRPPSGRSCRVVGSNANLWELRVTPRGRTGPHHRLLFIRERHTIYVARGLTKRERLTRHEIDLADDAVRRWREGR
jgi:hypothetical protein